MVFPVSHVTTKRAAGVVIPAKVQGIEEVWDCAGGRRTVVHSGPVQFTASHTLEQINVMNAP